MAGIVSYGVYLPRWELRREDVVAAVGSGRGRGARRIAGFDEDTTTMGFEAARAALQACHEHPHRLRFATTFPAYMEKTNAAAIHAALALPSEVSAVDFGGAVKSGAGLIRASLEAPGTTLAIVADMRVGRSGSDDELQGGDAAAAFVCTGDADASVIAEYLGGGAATAEVLDRWRLPSSPFGERWEEHFAAGVGEDLAQQALQDALKTAGVVPDAVDHLVAVSPNARATRSFARRAGIRDEALVDVFPGRVGNAGAAQVGIGLASALDVAAPGEVIAAIAVGDGAEAFVFRVTEDVVRRRPVPSVRVLAEGSAIPVPYARYLSWRGLLETEPPRKAPPRGPSAPAAYRAQAWKFGLVGSTCEACGTRHLPPQRVCLKCHAVDQTTPTSFSSSQGSLANVTVDRLAWSPSPPASFGVVDFDGGGRVEVELADVGPEEVALGTRVDMVFRRMHSRDGRHNYFWKARPRRAEEERRDGV